MMIETANQAAIILVAKMPVPGSVKTRLSPPLSEQAAASLYACFLQDSIDKLTVARNAAVFIAFNISDAPGVFETIGDDLKLPASVTVLDQGDGDLGARLKRLCRQGFAGVSRLVFIGSDSPTLPISHVERALDMLASYDVVIGPSDDGGYYLIGLSGNHYCLFEDIDWSTSEVFNQTLARANEANLTAGVLGNWFDVDDIAGLRRLREELLTDPAAAPQTAGYLADIRW